jgi:hypothetical protein
MKKLSIVLACVAAMLLSACRAHMPVAQQSGKEDVAYLLFVSQNGDYHKKELSVTVDDQLFTALGIRAKDANRRGSQYTAPTGTHMLIVKNAEGRTLYSKKVFLSSQEVKTITLP